LRVLFSSTGGTGHLLPLLPLATAFAARGDEVTVAAPENQRSRIEAERHCFAAVGPTPQDLRAEVAAHQARVEQLPIAERRAVAFSGRFGRIEAPKRLAGLRELVERWSPDLMIHESADLAAPIAASAAGTPVVHHAFGRPIPEAALRQAADVVAPLWTRAGLEPDPLAGAYAGSYVDICPPSLQEPLPQRPARTFDLRPVDAAGSREETRERPLVYATLGTIFNERSTFRLLLDVLATIDCDVVMTTGHGLATSELEPIPPNATVATYIPQAEILAGCDLVIAHGGSGSLLGALAHGRPLVLVPRGADQFDNANASAALGVAEVIVPAELAAERLRDAITSVVTSPAYADAARRVATEIAAMPPASSVAAELAT
jgi:UDP:flavonoid glycosyltransferase YjiC (YdhE family)